MPLLRWRACGWVNLYGGIFVPQFCTLKIMFRAPKWARVLAQCWGFFIPAQQAILPAQIRTVAQIYLHRGGVRQRSFWQTVWGMKSSALIMLRAAEVNDGRLLPVISRCEGTSWKIICTIALSHLTCTWCFKPGGPGGDDVCFSPRTRGDYRCFHHLTKNVFVFNGDAFT